MESRTTIEKLFQGNKISVPKYQRAYSWETPKKDSERSTQTDVFLQDLEDYISSKTKSTYYFGHFLFEHTEGANFNVIDGQQRITTIQIFLAALFKALRNYRDLNDEEEIIEENIIKRRNSVHFSTVEYDNIFFKDYVIFQNRESADDLDTESARRIARAFDFFNVELQKKDEDKLLRLLSATISATCTTHQVEDEAEAIQMFIFQNNRGKKPTNLEVIKARFMYHAHLYGGDEANDLINDIKERFEHIYKAISAVEYNIGEDEVLGYTLRVYFNSLSESGALSRIDRALSEDDSLEFVRDFTRELALNFSNLSRFFGKDEKEYFEIHSLITLGGFGFAMPFILKAYKFGIDKNGFLRLCTSLESLILRHRLIGTRAEMTSRLNDVYQSFSITNKTVEPIIKRISFIKKQNQGWWSHWSDERFKESLEAEVHAHSARFLLWKYDNSLSPLGPNGYKGIRFDNIRLPEVEHIQPQTEPKESPHGYGEYSDEFRTKFLNCLGNYALISKTHNCKISNSPFWKKHESYDFLEHQKEIQKLVPKEGVWNNEVISKRNDKIKTFVLQNF